MMLDVFDGLHRILQIRFMGDFFFTHRIRLLLALVRGGDDSQVLDHLLGVFGLPRSGLASE